MHFYFQTCGAGGDLRPNPNHHHQYHFYFTYLNSFLQENHFRAGQNPVKINFWEGQDLVSKQLSYGSPGEKHALAKKINAFQ